MSLCARPGCSNPAVASFNFDGLARVVWLGPLADACVLEGVDEVTEVATPSDGFNSDVWRAALEALVRDRSPEAVPFA